MKTINIKGKEYVQVNERLKAFRENYKDWSLVSEIMEMTADSILMKASVITPDGVIKATGHAKEFLKKNTSINATSMVENCETSAWGRALGNFGIGIDKNICTAEDVLNAEAEAPERLPEPLVNAITEAPDMEALKSIYSREYQGLESAALKAEFASLCAARKQELRNENS